MPSVVAEEDIMHLGQFITVATCLALSLCLPGCFLETSDNSGKRPVQDCSTVETEEESSLAVRGGEIVTSDSEVESEFRTVGKLIGSSGGSAALCTGNLIAPNFILTADHCVQENEIPLTEFTFQQNEGFTKAKATKVFRYDGPAPFRDVALVMLDGYFDETLDYPRLMKRALPETYVDKPLRMVGFGGYTDNSALYSYKIGEKRTGEALFTGYDAISTEFFGANVDFLAARPGSDNNEMICQGDSGSSLFYTDGPFKLIVGITSIGEFDTSQFVNPADGTKQEKCHYSTLGFFVPSYRVYEWVNDTIKAQEPNYRNLDTEIVATGVVDSVSESDDGTSVVLLSNLQTHDAPVNTAANEFVITPDTTVLGSLYVGREVLVQGKSPDNGSLPEAVLIADKKTERISKDIKIAGTITSAPITAEVFGRTETYVTLDRLRIGEEDYDKLPVKDRVLDLIICTKGCSVNVDIDVDQLAKGDEVSVSGDYIMGRGFYARAATGSFVERANAECTSN